MPRWKNLPAAKLTFDKSKGMLRFNVEVSLHRLIQIQKPALCCFWNHSVLAGLHGNPELSIAVLDIATLFNADRACIAVDEAFIPMEPHSCCVQLMHVGGGALNRVGQARCAPTPMWQHIPKKHCGPLATSVHVRIPPLALVLVAPPRSACGLGKVETRSNDDRTLSQYRSPLDHHLFHTLEELLRDPMLLQQMANVENRSFVGDPAFHRIVPCEAVETGQMDQHLLPLGI